MLQTQFSVRATDLAESFRSTLGRLRVGPHGFVPDMTAPEGPSTGGGVQAVQHVRLIPPQPNMLEYVDAISRERFKQGAPLDPAQYAQFLQSAQGFLAACGLKVVYAGPPADLIARLMAPTPSMVPAKSGGGMVFGILGAILLVGVLAAAVAWFYLKR